MNQVQSRFELTFVGATLSKVLRKTYKPKYIYIYMYFLYLFHLLLDDPLPT